MAVTLIAGCGKLPDIANPAESVNKDKLSPSPSLTPPTPPPTMPTPLPSAVPPLKGSNQKKTIKARPLLYGKPSFS
ncbi:hypothetical protein [Candidatus Endomicrobiellum agilis]|uniref:hypothetical protein n=1 Tax=Candidatus Endomicrobiellum agilis TaxID=3238957 RepID=UPI0035864527|nr:hypothetical protein [Endomicrobium sp.]